MKAFVRVALTWLALAVSLPSSAQTADFSVLLNNDNNPATGCTVTASGQTFAGADARIFVTATVGLAPVVQDVRLQPCIGGVFAGPGTDVGGPHPVGLDNGVGGSDVVEFSAPLVGVLPTGQTFVRLGVLGQNASGTDVLFTSDGTIGGPPFGLAIPQLIPTLTAGGLLLLGALVLLVAVRFGRHKLTARVVGVSLIVASGVVLAANFVVDGQVGDWAGEPQLATDAAGDASNGSASIDLRAFFAAREGDNVFFRIDVGDLENQPPVMNPAAATTNEDTAVTVTLTGTDPEGQPITFAIATPPANGTLSGLTQVPPSSATVLYTPNPDFFGTDTFTFTGTDGQATSAPGTATITVNPVNDAPSFTASNPPAVNEDAGPQTIAGWATFDPGPANESAQTVLAYNVTNVSNGALFLTPPAVATNGTLTYTSAADAFGTSTFDVSVQDSGGTANGGVDTSPIQTFTITVNAVNDPPVLTAGATLAYTENQAATAIDGTVTVNDVDDTNLESATARISAGFQAGADTLACPGCGAIGSAFAGDTLTLTGTATLAAYQTALRSVTYANSSENPTTAARTVTWIGNDGTVGSAPVTSTINVTAINDPPVNTVPGVQQTGDTTPLVFSTANGNALSTTDPDAGTGNILLNLSVAPSGTLTLGSTAGLVTVIGNGTGTVSATGQITAVNNALQGLTYTPVAGTSAAMTLTFTIDDQGNTPAPPQTDTDLVTINVDAPPAVTTVVPPNGATGVPTNTSLTVNFNESVTVAVGGITLDCGAGNIVTGGLPATGTSVVVTTSGAPAGTLCTGTVVAANVTDTDAIDPPNNMAANFTWSFTTDAAPTVTTTTPPNGATNLATDTNITVNFSESVNATTASFTIECPAPGNLQAYALSASPSASFTLNPTVDLPPGVTCTVTVIAAQITDADGNDPPDNMAANFVFSFTTDAAPAVTTVSPLNGATQVGTSTDITVNFSESVNATTASFTIECPAPGNLQAYALSASPSATFTLNPTIDLPPGTLCTVTVLAAQITDADANDPPNNMAANFVFSFTTDVAPTVTAVTPPNGSTALVGSDVTVTFSEPVTVAGTWFTIACNLSGTRDTTNTVVSGGPTTFTINPNTDFTPGETCNGTIVATQVADVDTGDPPNNMAANFTWSFITDAAPTVTTTTPPNGATNLATNTDITVNFSESVNATTASFTIECPAPGNLQAYALSASPSASFTLNPNVDLPPGVTCTVTVIAAQITDADANDPPDNMAANFAFSFTTDAAPTVTTTTPINGATNVPTDANITVNFSESVNATTASLTIECPAPGNLQAYALSASPSASFTLNPNVDLPPGVTCTVTVIAAQITDADANDPPDNMAANFVFSFTTDAAPTVTTVVPLNGATQVAINTNITVNFSESVNATTASFTVECPAPGNLQAYALSASPAASFTLNPNVDLPPGTLCTVTVLAAQITDADLNDPPNNMAANFVFSFTTDAAPSVLTTVPANGVTGQLATGNITINFSESVNFDTTANAANTSFDLECPVATPAGFTVVTASPATSVVLNPVDADIAGRTCTLTVQALGITDADAGDPPDNMLANFTATIGFAGIANDDTYVATPNLTLSVPSAAAPNNFNILTNDLLGGETLSSFGSNNPAGTCTGTALGGTGATAQGGTVTLQASGAFVYSPPPGARSPVDDSFCYSISGGDTAVVTLDLQAQQAIWFVDNTAAAGGNGTQAAPFQQLVAFAGVVPDVAGDTIFVADGNSTCGGVILLANEILVGDGSTGTLAGISGVTPVSGSTLPAFSGTDPVLSSAASITDCVILGTGNTVRGLTIGDVGLPATGDSSDLSGNGFGTLTLLDVTLNGRGRALNLVNGTLAAGSGLNGLASTRNTGGGVNLDTVAGPLTVAGTATFDNNGAGVSVVRINASSGTFTFGDVTIDRRGGPGLNLVGNSGAIQFGAVTVNNQNTSATSAIAIDNSTAASSTTLASATLNGNAAAAAGVALSGNAGPVNINGGAVTNTAGTDIQVSAGDGNATIAASTTNTAGRSIEVLNRTGGTTTLSGAIGDTGTGINITGNTGGTINLTNAAQVLNTGSNAAVTLSGNAGATINFTGGALDIDTTSGVGFSATGPGPGAGTGGTVTVQGAGNTIDSISATALNVVNTTIGAADLTFVRVSSGNNTAAADPASGIVLNNTGATGNLAVVGTGAAASGGTIQNTTSHGISLAATLGPSFNNVSVIGTGGNGVFGSLAVTNFTFTNGLVDDSGRDLAAERANIGFNTTAAGTENNLQGVVTITGNTLTNAYYHGIDIFNFNGTISSATLSNNTITSSTIGGTASPCGGSPTPTTCSRGSGIRFIAFGSAGTIANVTTATIANNIVTNFPAGPGIQAQGGNGNLAGPVGVFGTAGSGTNIIAVTSNTVRGASAANRIGTFALAAVVNGRGQGNFDVSNNGTVANPVRDTLGTTLALSSFGFANVTATASNNVIVSNNAVGAQGMGVGSSQTAGAGETPALTATMTGNNISQTDGNGMLVVARDASATDRYKIQTNVVAAPLAGNRNGIRVDSGNGISVDEDICLNISGNTTAGVGLSPEGIGLRKQGAVIGTNNLALHGFATSPANQAQTAAYSTAQNPGSASGTLIIAGDNFNSPICSFP